MIPSKPIRVKNGAKLQRTNKVQFIILEEVERENKEGKALKHTFKVRGRENASYTVTHQENEWNCNCADFEYRGIFPGQICKHIMAVIIDMAFDEVTPDKEQATFDVPSSDEGEVYEQAIGAEAMAGDTNG